MSTNLVAEQKHGTRPEGRSDDRVIHRVNGDGDLENNVKDGGDGGWVLEVSYHDPTGNARESHFAPVNSFIGSATAIFPEMKRTNDARCRSPKF